MNLYYVEGVYILAYSQIEALNVSGKKGVVASLLLRSATLDGVPRQITTGEARGLMND